MMMGQILTDEEQDLYDNTNDNNEEKLNWLQSEIKNMVENKRMTASEKDELLHILSGNVENLGLELDQYKSSSSANNDNTKIAILNKKLSNIKQRIVLVESIGRVV
jgi:hypothetical protein